MNDGDLFVCGKCKTNFTNLELFLIHRSSCRAANVTQTTDNEVCECAPCQTQKEITNLTNYDFTADYQQQQQQILNVNPTLFIEAVSYTPNEANFAGQLNAAMQFTWPSSSTISVCEPLLSESVDTNFIPILQENLNLREKRELSPSIESDNKKIHRGDDYYMNDSENEEDDDDDLFEFDDDGLLIESLSEDEIDTTTVEQLSENTTSAPSIKQRKIQIDDGMFQESILSAIIDG
ncbi:unnamed protein product [Didymodactylos carnosus]|uniref:Uncharacterized protein n=1 Tax=Didymodactylos carnosus TaxID=1234261 RepID=A0A8S2FFX1_9BILA|nr:unnamed protein product [Didymodactylos carnosus]CAF4249264.1 unnamed protein product [Didymodactylos carnosus]